MFAIAPLLPGFHEVVTYPELGPDVSEVVRPDPRRAILYVTNDTASELQLWLMREYDAGMPPHYVVGSSSVLRLTWSEDGPMSTFGWVGILKVGTGLVSVVEVRWLPEHLAGESAG